MTNQSVLTSYLPLQKFHIVPITSLDPLSLKKSAKFTKRDREKIPHSTLLNATVKALGVKGGFSSSQDVYDSQIKPFLKSHGMSKRKNLLKPRMKGDCNLLPDITHQDLSERFFYSGWKLPQKVFTGYDFNYTDTIADGQYYLNSMLCPFSESGPHGLKNTTRLVKDSVESNILIARNNPNAIIPDCKYPTFSNRKLIDIVLGGFMMNLDATFHLLGDSLVVPAIKASEVERYYDCGDLDFLNKENEVYHSICALFRERIEQSDDGWIEVISFNEHLIFLKGKNGEYNFVFKNQRNKVFEHQIFGNVLKRSDIPACISDYHFSRWHYFEYQGWRHMDSHCSENYFYEKGNHSSSYPGRNVILQDYHKAKGNFISKKLTSNERLTNFNEVLLDGKTLMVSQLISIDDLNDFAVSRADYMEYRAGDNLNSVNSEDDSALPASTTWFDALAYLDWFEDNSKIPVRLLTVDEYSSIRAEENISKIREPIVSDLHFVSRDGKIFPQHPPYMAEDEFQSLALRFSNTEKVTNSSGLEFMQSNYFAEWLMEGTCIRSGNLKSFYNDDLIIRAGAPRYSTGKYKGVKIGFRICYELEAKS
ncbi:hypothetical protein [Moritella viscosa]|uniref:Sulfatase-modifying factor enzyme domain-containing protein n=1 Tax=Moritella viscosa TaxID=80854 RepID=A0A1L0CPZ6_9GAMM|nr:hypothetical protein [Moritella viscosa]SGZ20391.1 Putative uncharacterized protein [Moritella viscosa]SHO06055.1 Putative uncharacterized protein [Moritella viscosa]SHO15480.1 Putative uncharacterized protein [Moritella viscosa]SHO15863.1 Putative uncharacterized protein [Moritella viscosa]SHO19080.1 Putative uncharacterized protein [Moritella viscosa]